MSGNRRIYSDEERKARKASYEKRRRIEQRERVRAIENASNAKRRDAIAKWRVENKDHLQLYFKERYLQLKAAGFFDSEETKEKRRAYYAANKERLLAAGAARKKANPESARRHSHTRRARLLGGGELSPGIVEKLMRLQRGKCANCHKKLTAPQIDHVLPVSRGGSNTDDNVQLLCGFCNRRKHAKDPIAFAQEQGRLL